MSGSPLDQRVGQDAETPQPVVENEDRVGDHEDHVRHIQPIWLALRQFADGGLEEPDNVVSHEADGAPGKPRQPRQRHGLEAGHQFLKLAKRIRLRLKLARLPVFGDGDGPAAGAEKDARIAADKRVTAAFVAVLGGLQQEGVAAAIQFFESGDGRLRVGDQLRADRDEIAVFCQLAELFAAGGDEMGGHLE